MTRIMLFITVVLLSALTVAEEPLSAIPPIPRLLPPEGVELPQEERTKLEDRLAAIEERLEPLRKDPLSPDIEIFIKAVRFAIDLHEFYDIKRDVAKSHKLLDEAEKRLVELQDAQRRLLAAEEDVAKASKLFEEAVKQERGEEAMTRVVELEEANDRLMKLKSLTRSWTKGPGFVVRGYRSQIDGSVQPYGVEYPERAQRYHGAVVWLHGRGDTSTDLHFIHQRMNQSGPLGSTKCIVIHPFGRQCVGFKSAGEVDVFDALAAFHGDPLYAQYRSDPASTGLAGFSMGGAGAWHIGAHFSDRFQIVAPGAGFVETALYTGTDPATVPWYERTLWGSYDVPCYTRNLFNTPVIAYSGERDKQIQAARIMEAALKTQGKGLYHLIGKGVGHEYEPGARKQIVEYLEGMEEATHGPFDYDRHHRVSLQTRTLRYNTAGNAIRMLRAQAWGLERHWVDATIDAGLKPQFDPSKAPDPRKVIVKTKNITAMRMAMWYGDDQDKKWTIDGQEVEVVTPSLNSKEESWASFEKVDGKWTQVKRFRANLQKRPGRQGPIDDVFLTPFLVVAPSGTSKHPLVQRWTEFELAHFVARWRALMRGDVRIKQDNEVTDEDLGKYSLVCFGDPDSNSIIRKAYNKLPVTWKDGQIVAGDSSYAADTHVPALIFPNPLAVRPVPAKPPKEPRGLWPEFDLRPTRPYVEPEWQAPYLVINSGLTFREAHDKTNSQQNPKLPDWAVIDLTQLPDDKAPGRIAAAGFFDEEWKYQEHSDP